MESPLPLDKAAHFLLYGLLGVLVWFGWRRARSWPALHWPIMAAVLVGVMDELHQRSVQGRSSELADLLADTLGILVGVWLTRHANQHSI